MGPRATNALAACGLLATAGVAAWAIASTVTDDSGMGPLSFPSLRVPVYDDVWCGGDGTKFDPTCDYGSARCEERRAALRVSTAECSRRDRACFIIATADRLHHARFCTVNFDECERMRVRQGAGTVSVTACAVIRELPIDSVTTFLQLRGPDTCYDGEPCRFRECYEIDPGVRECYSTAADCDAGRRLAKADAPCKFMP